MKANTGRLFLCLQRNLEDLHSSLLVGDGSFMEGRKVPDSIEELVSLSRANKYDAKEVVLNLKAMVRASVILTVSISFWAV